MQALRLHANTKQCLGLLLQLTCMIVSATVTGSPVVGDSSGCPVVEFSTGCCQRSAVISLVTNAFITQAIGLM